MEDTRREAAARQPGNAAERERRAPSPGVLCGVPRICAMYHHLYREMLDYGDARHKAPVSVRLRFDYGHSHLTGILPSFSRR